MFFLYRLSIIFVRTSYLIIYLFDRKTTKVFNNNIRISIHLQISSYYDINIFFFFKFVAPTFTKRLMIRIVVICISRPRGRIRAFCGVVGSIYVTKYNKIHIRDIPQGKRKSLWWRYESRSCGVISSSAGRHNIIMNSL
jgi:hypothetical protein